MHRNFLKLLLLPLLTCAFPVLANDFDQVWSCELKQGKSIDDAKAVSQDWLTAARSMTGGDQLQASINYPIVVDPSSERFEFVLTAPSLQAWGTFYDGYKGDSPVAGADAKFAEVANCSGSAMWESIKLE